MPTPVGVARQCLADAAAAVLDDAVAVARRRSHAQTTSLHVVSALLALPSSALREACSRARSCAYSPRLQFRALELCVGVALDRVSVSKPAADEPPVSNSLMAAIKRSQANQRRHPDTFHLYQQQLSSNSQNPTSISAVKVELKHFMISILDDPIVSRVLGDAGFRTHEIKMSLLNPLTMSRFSLSAPLPPPLFQCNLSDFELNKRIHSFPFAEAAPKEICDENLRRIGEILSKTARRNPLLIGVYASDACRNFIDCLNRGESGALPKEIDGLRVVSLEDEIAECTNRGVSEEMIESKFKLVDETVKDCNDPGIIINCGDFKAFVGVESIEVVNYVVLKLKRSLIKHGRKLRLIGFLAGDDDYKKLLQHFPSVEMDLDLNLLPITTPSMGGKSFKSSLMKSFVPFGGFFSMPSGLENPCTMATKPLRLCNLCNEKYEQEVSHVQKGVSTDSVGAKKSIKLPSWLQTAECETSKRSCIIEAKEDKSILDARVMALQRKWSDICQRLHCSRASEESNPLTKLHASSASSFNVPLQRDTIGVGSLSIESRNSTLSRCKPSDFQKNSLPNQSIPLPVHLSVGVNTDAEVPGHIVCTSSTSVFSVITDLTLGTHNAAERLRKNPDNHHSDLQNSESSRSHEKSFSQVSQSSSCSHHHHLEKHTYSKDLEDQWKILAETVYWQKEAIQTICQTISRCRNGNEKHHCSSKGNVWLSFLGPDKVGKRKIAASVAQIVFGRKEHFLSFDLNSQDANKFNSAIDCYDSKCHKTESGRKMLVDCLAEELSKHPHSVVLLENVEKADFLVQCSLSQAVKTGKFPDSHGRDINLNNNVIILASTVLKASKDPVFGKVASEFPEDAILEAKNMQMQILIGLPDDNNSRNSATHVSVSSSEMISTQCPSGKRKSIENKLTKAQMSKRACQLSRSAIDLNLPVENMEEECDTDKSSDDDNNDDHSEEWSEELLEHVHENIVFKPFDFDSLSRRIVRNIDAHLKRLAGPSVKLEIDRQVMAQILAAAWLTEGENALDGWIERVLFPSIDQARQRCDVASALVLKLLSCDGFAVDTRAPGVCLPAKINVK